MFARLCKISLILFILLSFVIPRSFVSIKFPFLVLPFIYGLFLFFRKNISLEGLILMTLMAILGILGALNGWLNNFSSIAIFEGLKLFVIYPLIIYIIALTMIQLVTLKLLQRLIVAGFILILIVNVIAVYNFYYNTVPIDIQKELDMYVGIHEGYMRIMTQNIGMLFFIMPIVVSLSYDRGNIVLTFLATLVAFLTGRRMLIINTLLVLFVKINFVSKIVLIGCLSIVVLFYTGDNIDFVLEAFDWSDPRYLQSRLLFERFVKDPLLGSGFGASVDLIRNEERPWIYENSIFQMLMNFGIAFTMFLFYMLYMLFKLSRISAGFDSQLSKGVVLGLSSILLSSFSNPYLGSFDFIWLLFLAPYSISKWRNRFLSPAERALSAHM